MARFGEQALQADPWTRGIVVPEEQSTVFFAGDCHMIAVNGLGLERNGEVIVRPMKDIVTLYVHEP